MVPLVVSTLGITAVMAVYELAKEWVRPDITLLESHIATIVFSALLGSVAVFIVLRRRPRTGELVAARDARGEGDRRVSASAAGWSGACGASAT